MKRYLTILILPFVLGAMVTSASATDNPYGWTLSDSFTNPHANMGNFVPGILNLVLWYNCSTSAEDGGPGGMASAQFAVLSKSPANIVLSFTAGAGFLNAGPPPAGDRANLLLAVGGCPVGQDSSGNELARNAGTVLILSNAPGQYGLTEFDAGDGLGPLKATVDCAAAPALWGVQWNGYSNDGGDFQTKNWDKCARKGPISVEETSWSTIKTIYR